MRAPAVLCALALGACPSGPGATTSQAASSSASSEPGTAETAAPTSAPTSTGTPGNVPPTAQFTGAPTVDTAAPLRVVFNSTSSDPDGEISQTRWSFGDGALAEGTQVEHTFVDEGSFEVTLTVVDDDGASAEASATVTVGGCPKHDSGVFVGKLQEPGLVEASGLAVSRRSPGVLWTHNDSEDAPHLYTFTLQGAPLGVYTLQGAEVRDWEDMALGPGPKPDQDYLYVGDIGDNNEEYASVTVYRAPEPPVDPRTPGVSASLGGVEALVYTYPGGTPHNTETLLIDPRGGDLYIVTKAGDGRSLVFRGAAPLQSGVLEEVTEIAFGAGGLTTGGSVSAAGDWVVVRTYFAARMWHRGTGTPLWQAFAGPACLVPLMMEMQGEAIGFAGSGIGYFTTSEGENPPLYFHARE